MNDKSSSNSGYRQSECLVWTNFSFKHWIVWTFELPSQMRSLGIKGKLNRNQHWESYAEIIQWKIIKPSQSYGNKDKYRGITTKM